MRFAALMAFMAALLLSGLAALPSSAEDAGGIPTTPRQDSVALAAGDLHSCAVVSSGELRCWGGNGFGQLGQGNTSNVSDSPTEGSVQVNLGPGRRATAVSLGTYHSCAISDVSALRCWGRNNNGQLGQGNTTTIGDGVGESTVPVTLGGNATAVALGFAHSCAIVNAQFVRCWGHNDIGQLAQGHTNTIGDGVGETTAVVDLGPGVTATAIAAGDFHTCSITGTGQLRCWGDNNSGQLGQGHTEDIGDEFGEPPVAVNLGAGRTATAVATGRAHTCAITDLGQLLCWGANLGGQLGQGHTNTIGDGLDEGPVPVNLGAGRTAIAVSAGWSSTCAITDLGELRCWGYNDQGQLGQGHTSSIGDNPGESTVAVDLGMGRKAVAVTVGYAFVCAALDDRTVRCWGGNGAGSLGQGSAIDWGANLGEVPGALPPVRLGGALFGRDTDGDGVRDAADGCPTIPVTTTSGCVEPPTPSPSATPTASPTVTPTPTPTPAPTTAPTTEPTTPPQPPPAVTLVGKALRIKAFVRRQVVTDGCPTKAKVVVKVGRKVKAKARLAATTKTKHGIKGCQVKGQIKLAKKPPPRAKVKVIIGGKNLKTKSFRALRS